MNIKQSLFEQFCNNSNLASYDVNAFLEASSNIDKFTIRKIEGREYLFDPNIKKYFDPHFSKTGKLKIWISYPNKIGQSVGLNKGKSIGLNKGKSIGLKKGKFVQSVDPSKPYADYEYFIFEELQQAAQEFSNGSELKKEKFFIICTKIVRQSYFYRQLAIENDRPEDWYCYLSTTDLEILSNSSDKQKILDILERNECIEIQKVQSVRYGRKFKRIKPTDKFLSSKKQKAKIKFRSSEAAIRKYNTIKNQNFKYEHIQLIKFISTFDINITREQFLDIAKQRYIKKNLTITFEQYLERFDIHWNTIQDWNNTKQKYRIEFCSIDSFGYRFHHIFTRLPKEIRSYTPCIVEMDLAQSQPMLMAHTMVTKYGLSKEDPFIKDIETKDYYSDVIVKEYNISRDEAKVVAMTEFFSRTNSKHFNAFKNRYPAAGAVLEKIKSVQRDPKIVQYRKVLEPYKNNCLDAQRAETAFFFEIWHDLIVRGIRFIPVHDAIYCLPGDKKMILTTFTDFINNLSVSARIKIKELK